MTRVLTALMLLAASAMPAAAAGVTPERTAELISTVIEAVIQPGYDRLNDEAATLSRSLEALCGAPSPAALTEARARFAATAAAWAAVEFIRFGPVMEEHRLERFHFWPDERGIGLRQVQALIAQKDESATEVASLAGKSVAVQGLPALEFVLHGTGAEALAGPEGVYRCRYGAAIAANLANIAAELAAAWRRPDGYSLTWTTPGDDNPIYHDASESLLEFLEIFTNAFVIMAEQKLEPPLGKSIDEARGRSAELWRSGMSGPMLIADAEGLVQLLQRSGIAGILADDVNTSWIVPGVVFELGEVVAKLKEVVPPVSEAVSQPDYRGKLEYVVIVLKSLGQLTASRLADSLGLQVGFNALDGD